MDQVPALTVVVPITLPSSLICTTVPSATGLALVPAVPAINSLPSEALSLVMKSVPLMPLSVSILLMTMALLAKGSMLPCASLVVLVSICTLSVLLPPASALPALSTMAAV